MTQSEVISKGERGRNQIREKMGVGRNADLIGYGKVLGEMGAIAGF